MVNRSRGLLPSGEQPLAGLARMLVLCALAVGVFGLALSVAVLVSAR